MTENEIQSAGEQVYDEALRSVEYCHDGERLPDEFRSVVFRVAASKLLSLALYLDENTNGPRLDT